MPTHVNLSGSVEEVHEWQKNNNDKKMKKTHSAMSVKPSTGEMHVGKLLFLTLKRCATYPNRFIVDKLWWFGFWSDHSFHDVFSFSLGVRLKRRNFCGLDIYRVCLHNGFVAFVVSTNRRLFALLYIRCDNASSARVRSHCWPNEDLSIDSIATILIDRPLPEFHLPFPAMPWSLDWSTFYPEGAWKFGSRSRIIRASCYRYSHVWACWPNSQTHFQKVLSRFLVLQHNRML